MTDHEISYNEAQAALQKISRKEFEKTLRPDGKLVHISVFDRTRLNRDLPHVGITLYINGTWEYEDGSPASGAEQPEEDDGQLE